MTEDRTAHDAEHGAGSEGTRKGIKKPRSEGQRRAAEQRSAHIKTVGKPLPSCPMSPDELMEAWNIGQGDAMGITVKVLRQTVGTTGLDLIESVPLVQFDGHKLAANYGPGRYLLRPAAGQYAKCSAILPVSDELARSCGFGRLPVTAQDMAAERTLRQAVQGPSDPLDLLAAVEQMMNRKFAEFGMSSHPTMPMQAGNQGPSVSFDPMQAMQSQMTAMRGWMGFMDEMERGIQARVERRLGVESKDEAAQPSQVSLLESLLPVGLKILDRFMAGPAHPPMRQLPPSLVATPVIQTAPNEVKPLHELPPQEARPMPELTPQERQSIGMAVKMLQPFAPQLVALAGSQATNDQIVGELEGYIPDHMVEPITTLANVVQKHGHGVLEVIHPGLATERWASILPMLAEALK